MAIDKLYIIGNGFDAHHGMQCSYSNFREWLCLNKRDVYDSVVRLYEDGLEGVDKEWWNDFEENLGNLPIRYHIENISFRNQPDEDELEKCRVVDTMRGAWDAQEQIGVVIDSVKEIFSDWIESLTEARRGTKLQLDTDNSFFITFNYTLTLENVYGIEDDKIKHLHGSLNDKNYIVGHGRSEYEIEEEASKYVEPYDGTQDPGEYLAEMLEDEITENTKEAVVNSVKSIAKLVEKIIKENEKMFEKLSNVKEVYIFGFSFSDVDMPYMKTIKESVHKDAKFIISWYSQKDIENVEKFKKECYVDNEKCELVKLVDLQIERQGKLEFID